MSGRFLIYYYDDGPSPSRGTSPTCILNLSSGNSNRSEAEILRKCSALALIDTKLIRSGHKTIRKLGRLPVIVSQGSGVAYEFDAAFNKLGLILLGARLNLDRQHKFSNTQQPLDAAEVKVC